MNNIFREVMGMQNVAFALIILSVLALVGWLVQDFFTSSNVPLLAKVAAGTVGVGVLILVGMVIKDRVGKAKAKTEEFKDVER
ncbi:hypothetical protein ACFLXP_01720 [Chloroflexota bacterium]